MILFKDKRYLFHIHTDYTDGQLTIKQYFSVAKKYNLTLGFLEHIRSKPSYDPFSFIAEVEQQGKQTKVPYKIGFEIGVSKSELNIPLSVLQKAAMVGLAVHGYIGSPLELLTSYIANLKQIREIRPDIPVIWVHPGLWFRKNGYLQNDATYFFKLLNYAVERNILIEINKKYDLLPKMLVGMVPQSQRINGEDIHTQSDLNRFILSIQSK